MGEPEGDHGSDGDEVGLREEDGHGAEEDCQGADRRHVEEDEEEGEDVDGDGVELEGKEGGWRGDAERSMRG